MSSVDLSIVIVSWNVRELLRACLQALQTTTQTISFEVLVVDNASSDGTVEMVATEFPQHHLIALKENIGFAAANNLGASHARGEIILFLNDDTQVYDHTLDQCVAYLRTHAEVGVLGCQLINSDQTLQPSVRKDPGVYDQSLILLKIPHIFPSTISSYMCVDFDYQKTQTVEQVMGAFFMMPRAVFDQMNGWDEGYFLWFEEVDMCTRVRAHGYSVVYLSTARCLHHKGASFASNRPLRLQKIWQHSLLRYMRLYQSWYGYLTVRTIALLVYVPEKILQGIRQLLRPRTDFFE